MQNQIKYVYTESEFIHGSQRAFLQTIKRQWYVLGALFAILFGPSIITQNYQGLGELAGGTFVLYAALFFYYRRKNKKLFRTTKAYSKECTVTLLEDGLISENADSKTKIEWDFFAKPYFSKDFLYLPYKSGPILMLPTRAFADAGQIEHWKTKIIASIPKT